MEALGGVHRILARHGVHHQHNLLGLYSGFNGLQLLHEGFVDVEPAGRVQEDHVVAVANGMLHSRLGNVHGIGLAHLEHREPQLLAADLQLPDGGGTVDVTGHQEGVPALAFHQPRQLGAVGGFASALRPTSITTVGPLGLMVMCCVSLPMRRVSSSLTILRSSGQG